VRWLEQLHLPRERRALRHVLAAWGGYFWLPCPCCGEPFAGYEVGQRHVDHEKLPGGGWTSQCCCRWCDTCPGAISEWAALEKLVGAFVEFEYDGPVWVLRNEPTPLEWRCRHETARLR